MSDIPLTTTFTPPASCFDNSWTSWDPDYYVKDFMGSMINCYPPGFTDLYQKGQPYSPGVCPDRYAMVTQMRLFSPRTGIETSPSVTGAYCCPRPMTRPLQGRMGCETSVSDQTVLTLPTKTTTMQNVTMAMPGVYVAWAQSDLSVFASAGFTSSSSSSSALPAPTASTSATARNTLDISPAPSTSSTTMMTPTPLPSSSTPQPGLPSRTIVGISIGATAALTLLATSIAFAVLARRRRRRKQAGPHRDPLDVQVSNTVSESHKDMGRWHRFTSLWSANSPRSIGGEGRNDSIPGCAKQEMGVDGEVHEADSKCVQGGEVAEADSKGVERSGGGVQEADSRCVGSTEITELEGD